MKKLKTAGIILAALLSAAGLAYGGVVAYMYRMQRKWLFNTDADGTSLMTLGEAHLPGGSWETRIVVEEHEINPIRTTVWQRRAGAKTKADSYWDSRDFPTVLYLHGNAGHLGRRAPRLVQIALTGYGFYAYAHRGFPGSNGEPTEENLVKDALFHYDQLNYNGENNVIIHGESLGTGIAVQVAAQREPKAVILEAPYHSILELVSEKYWYLPVSMLLKDQFLTAKYIGQVKAPMLLVHGALDELIPPVHSERLLSLPGDGPRERVLIDQGHHIDLWDHGIWSHAVEFLDRHGVGFDLIKYYADKRKRK